MRSTRSWLLAIVIAVIPPAYGGKIDAIYAFGDSLSDTGNAFVATGGTVPGAPYVAGRFSNGPIWIDDLAKSLGLPIGPSLLGGTDFAFGGAETGLTPVHAALSPTDLLGAQGQIAQFTALHPAADPNALYTIWIGSNDLDDVLLSGANAAQTQSDIGAIVANIDTSILDLAALGAHNFLILTVPDLGKTPAAISSGPAAVAGASLVSGLFDKALVGGGGPLPSLAALAAGAGLNLNVLDTYALLDSIVANAAVEGFTNTTGSCLTGAVNFAGGVVCSPNVAVQDQYVFWDQKHPTLAAHALVGAAALATITPEPASFAMFALGLAAICVFRQRLGRTRHNRT